MAKEQKELLETVLCGLLRNCERATAGLDPELRTNATFVYSGKVYVDFYLRITALQDSHHRVYIH